MRDILLASALLAASCADTRGGDDGGTSAGADFVLGFRLVSIDVANVDELRMELAGVVEFEDGTHSHDVSDESVDASGALSISIDGALVRELAETDGADLVVPVGFFADDPAMSSGPRVTVSAVHESTVLGAATHFVAVPPADAEIEIRCGAEAQAAGLCSP
jgi:hypothetical protein